VIDDLFKLPLAEFTAARNALAASLKEAGRADDAAAVKALTKPPLSAWAVNQLYWRHRKPFDHLMAVGGRLRKAQTLQLTQTATKAAGKGQGEPRGQRELRDLIDARSDALADLATHAAALLRESGHPATPDVTRRITTTLEALATSGDQPGAPAAGRLTADVDPPGFEALSALVPRSKGKRGTGGEPSRVIPFRPPSKATPAKKLSPAARKQQEEEERQAQRTAAMAARRDAERALRDARKAVAQSQAALRQAAARAKIAEKAKAELEKRLEQASAAADAARQEARRVASAAEDAAQALQDAENHVHTLKSKVESNS
jgi:hypothetical protein